MLESAYCVAAILPASDSQALAVLALAKEIVLKINKPYLLRLRDARSGGNGAKRAAASLSKERDRLDGGAVKRSSSGRSGAARKRSAISKVKPRVIPR